MSVSGFFEGWSPVDVAGILGLMLVMGLALAFNRSIAQFMVDSSKWTAVPPRGLIREDRPHRLAANRETRAVALVTVRWGLIAVCTMMLVAGLIALVGGRHSGFL